MRRSKHFLKTVVKEKEKKSIFYEDFLKLREIYKLRRK